MKAALLALVVMIALAQGQPPSVYVKGVGDKWHSSWDLEQIARDYAKQRKIPPNSVLAWVWFLGGFISFVGGILQIKQSRGWALLCTLGGFIVFFSAVLYLNEAARIFDQNRGVFIE